MSHTIIYSSGGGRTCDQLMTLAQFVAFRQEFGDEFILVDIPFWPFAAGFAEFQDNRACVIPFDARRNLYTRALTGVEQFTRRRYSETNYLSRLGNRLGREISNRLEWHMSRRDPEGLWIGDTASDSYPGLLGQRRGFLHLDEPDVLRAFRARRYTVICGPKIRCWSLVRKHKNAIVRSLRVRDDLQIRARGFVEAIRTNYDYLIGVLIRQYDYRRYASGRFFFESPQYASWMKAALTTFKRHGRVGFLIASDEIQDPSVFEGLPFHFCTGAKVGPGHYLENLAELGLCDVVMTPPSSFGCWGAFAGGVPVMPLTRRGQCVSEELLLPDLWSCTQHPEMKVAIW